MAKIRTVSCEGSVTKIGYNNVSQTVMYVKSEEAESFGAITKIIPIGTQYEAYDSDNNAEIMTKKVLFTYETYDPNTTVMTGVQFVGFVEEQ